jgi:glutamine synthetase
MKVSLEYIWIDGGGSLRCKNRMMETTAPFSVTLDTIPVWNFDGSSTGQAVSVTDSERFLKPAYICIDPFVPPITGAEGYLVMCAVYDDLQLTVPGRNNHYDTAAAILTKHKATRPWFGFEQEFFFVDEEPAYVRQGLHYCGLGQAASMGAHRQLMGTFAQHCLRAGLSLYGTNAEVAPGQWEFQIGTVEGLTAAHELWLARYILLRVAETTATPTHVSFEPKPHAALNGSGCHANFSNTFTRNPHGFANMQRMFDQLRTHHAQHIAHYGDNTKRLTGHHETSDIKDFTWSVAGRHTSVRVGQEVAQKGHGYFEDRRPASDCDPYLVAALLVQNTILQPIPI